MTGQDNGDHPDQAAPDVAVATRRFAWLCVVFATWIIVGVLLVGWALDAGLATDHGVSIYHVPGYSGLLALALFCIYVVIRGLFGGAVKRHSEIEASAASKAQPAE